MGGLVGGLPALVIVAEDEPELIMKISDMQARMDDAYWTRQCREPFSWQRFLNWWVARRWILPYDIRRSFPDGNNRLR